MPVKNILFFLFIVTSILRGEVCAAQKNELKDIKKIQLITRGGGLSNYYKGIEVIKEGNGWNSYQIKLIGGYNRLTKRLYNDSSRTFIRNIPENMLNELLRLISKPDTVITLALFNLDQKQLVKYIDTNIITLKPMIFKPVQKAAIIRALQSKDTLGKMLKRAVIPAFVMDDKNYYAIILTDKTNKSDTTYAYSFADPYYLPWIIKKAKSYNPQISLIYNFIIGNDNFAQQEKNQLYEHIDWWLYQTYFELKFNWDNLKTDQPEAYKLLGGTLTPTLFTSNKWGHTGFFKSSRLPPYIKISFGYMTDSTLASIRYKKFEDTLVAIFKQKVFLFSYLGSRENCSVLISPGKMGEAGKSYVKDIAKYYPEIKNINYKESIMFEVIDKYSKRSKWLYLPNNNVILLKYKGKLTLTDNIYFEGIEPYLRNARIMSESSVCIVFDNLGKKIAGNLEYADVGDY